MNCQKKLNDLNESLVQAVQTIEDLKENHATLSQRILELEGTLIDFVLFPYP